MAEMKGAMMTLALFLGMIMPLLIMVGVDTINQTAFMKHATELTDIVKEEGGQGAKASQVIAGMSERGYTVSVEGGGQGSTYGEPITIDITYKYDNIAGKRTLTTTKQTMVVHRVVR